jgi:hypothetical protein
MMEAASTSETSVNFYQTTRSKNPEDSHIHTRRSENLKSQEMKRHLLHIQTPSLIKIDAFTCGNNDGQIDEISRWFISKCNYKLAVIIISGTTARTGPWPPLTGFRDGLGMYGVGLSVPRSTWF